jgi:endonuclease/exonuclease/phosphatase family metal-dependent hydrolase
MHKKLKKIIHIGFIYLNCFVILLCLLSCLAPFLNPGRFVIITFFSLIFPFVFLSVLFFTLYWFFKKSKWAWLSVITILISLYQFSAVFGFHFGNTYNTAKAPENIRLLTWNLSSWGRTKRNNVNKTTFRKEMTDILINSNADIICLQEYPFLKEKTFRDTLLPELQDKGYKYNYIVRARYLTYIFKTSIVTGVAIISKFPLKDTAHFNFSEDSFNEPLIYGDITVNNQTLRIFTTHLQSVRLEQNDYEALHNLKEPVNVSLTKSRAVAGKLKTAYKKRAEQAILLHKKIKESPYPVLVCGDFNDVPGSFTYFTIKDNLQDAFLKKEFGFGRTYRFISPTLRIDYIMADKKFTVKQYTKIVAPYSDHYPVIADIKLNAY